MAKKNPPDETPGKGTNSVGIATVYGRISPLLKDDFKAKAREIKKNDNDVIEALIKYFVRLPKEHRESICSEDQETISSIEDSVERMASAVENTFWGDHAFNLGRWEASIADYHRVVDDDSNPEGLRRIASYKNSYSLVEIALGLIAELHGMVGVGGGVSGVMWDEYYDEASEALRASVEQSRKFIKLGGRPVIRFNSACCWSLLGQYAVEHALGPDAKLPGQKDFIEGDWQLFGSGWRDDERVPKKARAPLDRLVNGYTENALKDLAEMSDPGQKDPARMILSAILSQDSESDSDIRFLKYDLKSGPKYSNWLSSIAKKNSKLDIYKYMKTKII